MHNIWNCNPIHSFVYMCITRILNGKCTVAVFRTGESKHDNVFRATASIIVTFALMIYLKRKLRKSEKLFLVNNQPPPLPVYKTWDVNKHVMKFLNPIWKIVQYWSSCILILNNLFLSVWLSAVETFRRHWFLFSTIQCYYKFKHALVLRICAFIFHFVRLRVK